MLDARLRAARPVAAQPHFCRRPFAANIPSAIEETKRFSCDNRRKTSVVLVEDDDSARRSVRISVCWDLAVTACLGAVTLGVFVATLAPTVTAEDSGELIAAAAGFGIAHPPGYPLWTLACGVFIHIVSFEPVAYGANLFSALCASATAAVTFLALRQLPVSRQVAFAVPLVWVWSRWAWTQSVITEVYALNSLVAACGLLCVLRWRNTNRDHLLVALSFVLGLGMANHHIIAFSGVALGLWVVLTKPAVIRNVRLITTSVAAFLLGLLPYLYLPLRAAVKPAMNWGDPSTWSRFWDHVTRAQYGALGPMKVVEPRSIERLFDQIAYTLASICDDLTPLVTVLCSVALVWSAFRARRYFLLASLWLLATVVCFVLLSNFGLDRTSRWAMRVFLIPAVAGVLPVVALFLQHITTERGRGGKAGGTLARVVRLARSILCLALPLIMLKSNWQRCDYSKYFLAHDHAENILRCVMPNAIIFPTGDHNTFPLTYLRLVEDRRQDVTIADMYGYVDPEIVRDRPVGSGDDAASWLIKGARRPVYYTSKTRPPVEHAAFVPAGIVYHLLPDGMTFSGDGLLATCVYRNSAEPTVLDHGAANILAEYEFFRGVAALGARNAPKARQHFATSWAYGDGIKELANNIGSALAEQRLESDAVPYFRSAAALDRMYVVPRWNLVRLHKSRSQWRDASVVLLEIIRATPDDPSAYRELGFLRWRHLGDAHGAVEVWERSLQLDPNQPQVRAALGLHR